LFSVLGGITACCKGTRRASGAAFPCCQSGRIRPSVSLERGIGILRTGMDPPKMPFVQALAAPAGVFMESTLDDPAGAEDVVREPSPRDVEEAVRRLDGATFCQVTLSG